jgi:hypothetical protein
MRHPFPQDPVPRDSSPTSTRRLSIALGTWVAIEARRPGPGSGPGPDRVESSAATPRQPTLLPTARRDEDDAETGTEPPIRKMTEIDTAQIPDVAKNSAKHGRRPQTLARKSTAKHLGIRCVCYTPGPVAREGCQEGADSTADVGFLRDRASQLQHSCASASRLRGFSSTGSTP